MIRSLRGLAGLGFVILALAIAAIVGGGRTPVASHALVDRLDPTTATRLAWTYGDGSQQELVHEGPRWRSPTDPTADGALVDATTLDAVLTALRGGTWHRERGAGLQTPAAQRTTLVVTTPRGVVTLQLAPVAGVDSPVSGQTWVMVGARTVLVDDWIVRALSPTALELANHTPFARVATAASLTVRTVASTQIMATVRLAGSPLALQEPVALRAMPEALAALTNALAELEIVAFAKPTTATRPEVTIAIEVDRASGTHLAASIHAPCATEPCPCAPGLRLMSGDGAGDVGCIAAAQVDALVSATNRLTAAAQTLADPRPIDFTPVAIQLPDESVLRLAARPTVVAPHGAPVSGAPAAFDRIAELALVLSTPAPVIARPLGAPRPLLRVTGDHGEVVDLDRYPGAIIARRGEPVALQLGAGAVAILERPAAAYLETALWRADPFAVEAIAITVPGAAAPTVITRGQVIGEWRRDGTRLAADLAARADLAATQLAHPEPSPAPAPDGGVAKPTTHTVTLTIREPGNLVTHRFELTARGASCTLTSPATPGQAVSLELCDAIHALAP